MNVFVLPLSRILLSLVFIFTGYAKIFGWGPADKPIINMEMWKQRVAGLKMPFGDSPVPEPNLLAQIVAYGELVGGLLLFFGILSRLSAFGLFVFTIIASVIGHAFWSFAEPGPAFMQLQQFLKNMGIAGGLLIIVGAGGGSISVDGTFRRQP